MVLLLALGLLAVALAPAAPAAAAGERPAVDERAWAELDIVPMPKQIQLTDDDLLLTPEDIVLMIGADADAQSRIGAEWINQRLAEVGGSDPLPIHAGGESLANAEEKTAFIIGTVEDNPLIARAVGSGILDVGDKHPGERGYEIRRSADGKRVYLGGADPMGALYACVTIGELLEQREGQIVWRAAEVRDWPDYTSATFGTSELGGSRHPEFESLVGFNFSRIRNNAPSPEFRGQYLETVERLKDRLLRRKVSAFQYNIRWQILRNAPPESIALIREGIDYGVTRGIGALRYAEFPFVGLKEDHPGVESELDGRGRWPEWIRGWEPRFDPIRRQTARELAEWVAAMGFTDVGFHDTDTGGYSNPAQWAERSDASREHWGNDFAAATTHKLMIYYEALKEANPHVRIHFTFYPYTLGIIDSDRHAPELRQWILDTWQAWGDTFPEDTTFTIREVAPEIVDAFRDIWPHGIFIWNGLSNRSWLSFVDQHPSFMQTYFRDQRDYANQVPIEEFYVPLRATLAHEYSWNVRAPGAQGYRRISAEQTASDDRAADIYQVILPRVVRNLFGRDIADDVLEAVLLNIAPHQIFDEASQDQRSMLPFSEAMQRQADKAEQAAAVLDRAWQRMESNDAHVNTQARHYLTYLREVFHTSMWTARIRARKLHAMEQARTQDLTAAQDAIAEGLALIEQAEPALENVLAQRPDDFVIPIRHKYLIDGGGDHAFRNHHLDLPALTDRLEATRDELPDLARPIPSRLVQMLAEHRMIRATRVQQELDLNDAADHPAWADAWPVETFFALGESGQGYLEKPARAHTRARLLYDDEYLYVRMKAWFVGGNPPANPDAEGVELLLRPPGSEFYVHFMVGMNGEVTAHRMWPSRTPSLDAQWENAGFSATVNRQADHWTALLKVSFEDADGSPGAGWTANLSRSASLPTGREWSSTQPPGAEDNHDMEAFRDVVFASDAEFRPDIRIESTNLNVDQQTLDDAIATVATFDLAIDANHVLHDVVVRAETYGSDGTLEWEGELATQPRVYYRWESQPPRLWTRFSELYDEGGIRIVVEAAEGQAEHWIRFGGQEGTADTRPLFEDGLRAAHLQGPAWIPSRFDGPEGSGTRRLLESREGTIEFFIQPDWNVAWPPPRRASEYRHMTRVVLHCTAHPRAQNIHNQSSITLRFDGASGLMIFSVANHDYVQWIALAPVPSDAQWPAGQWRHVALVWDAEAQRNDWLRIYIDGKRVSRGIGISNEDRLGDDKSIRVPVEHQWPFQIRVSADGRYPAESNIRDWRISRVARYDHDFDVPDGPLSADEHTTAAFSFDRTLLGEGFDAAGDRYDISATPGVATWP